MKQRENQRERPEEEKTGGGGGRGGLTTCQCLINSYNPIISPPSSIISGRLAKLRCERRHSAALLT